METDVGVGRELPNVAVTDIPPLPEAALYVLSIARKPAVSADEVARALGSDQSIALRFLSIANSAYFATTHYNIAYSLRYIVLCKYFIYDMLTGNPA